MLYRDCVVILIIILLLCVQINHVLIKSEDIERDNITMLYSNVSSLLFKEDINTSDAMCDVVSANRILHDPQLPLTPADVALLRGCLVLLFLRTPRSGSSALYFLFNQLGERLGYDSNLSGRSNRKKLFDWNSHIDAIYSRQPQRPMVESAHLAVPQIITENSTEKHAVIINIIRHPIDHIISIFKYTKYGKKGQDGQAKRSKKGCELTLDDYLVAHGINPPCILVKFFSMRFICGRGCSHCSKAECLGRAKTNTEKQYLTIGLTENIPGPAFLTLMETVLPQFFTGALTEYVNMTGLYELFAPDPTRPVTLNNASMAFLKTELAEDLELYHFIKARFYTSLRKILEYRTIYR